MTFFRFNTIIIQTYRILLTFILYIIFNCPTMAKQITDDAGKFFDEMEEKMEAHDSKRSKYIK